MNIVHEQALLYLLKKRIKLDTNSTMLHCPLCDTCNADIAGYIFSKLGDLII